MRLDMLHRSVPLAVLLLALILLVVYHSLPHHSKGFFVRIAPEECDARALDRPVVLRVTREGGLFFTGDPGGHNEWSEKAERNDLATRLSDIYRTRAERLLYLVADDDVPFEVVADALDLTQNIYVDVIETPGTPPELRGGKWKLDITVSLVKSGAKCPPYIVYHLDPRR